MRDRVRAALYLLWLRVMETPLTTKGDEQPLGMAVYHVIGHDEVTGRSDGTAPLCMVHARKHVDGNVFPGTLLFIDAGKQPLAGGCLPRDQL